MVIIGAGQGGLQAAESLRSAKYDGDILLLGDEAHAPYNRPPLSKAFLLGEMTQDQLTIRQPAVFEKKRIELKTGMRVEAIDPKAQSLVCQKGDVIEYEKLIIATGSRARIPPIPNAHAEGVHCIRTLDDTLTIADEMDSVENLVVIGGGFIGLEMAAVARKLGKNVTVVEFADRLMARVVSPAVSAYYKSLHEKKGCIIRLNAAAEKILLDQGKLSGVLLNSGEELKSDMVVLGVGVLPNEELAKTAGLECDSGIIINNKGQTSDPNIYAIGDCTAQVTADGSLRRLESVQNAVEMAKAAANDIMGFDKPFTAAPWFWSDQYDVKLQMVGLSQGFDEMVLRGDLESGSFSYFYFSSGKLIAIDSFNQSADHMAGRKLLSSDNNLASQQAGDLDFNLRDAVLN
ncbi:MAG: FAD-dependent oxidoreductase [Methylocystaceae bacterium]|nr:FAD-dependent oxidoreductase [Methylocystaceae bacterium]